jgi:hypothetical protein
MPKREAWQDDVDALYTAKRTHQTHWTMPEMPWKKKPQAGKPKEVEPCRCGMAGKYFLNRWYCQECWDNGDDEDV